MGFSIPQLGLVWQHPYRELQDIARKYSREMHKREYLPIRADTIGQIQAELSWGKGIILNAVGAMGKSSIMRELVAQARAAGLPAGLINAQNGLGEMDSLALAISDNLQLQITDEELERGGFFEDPAKLFSLCPSNHGRHEGLLCVDEATELWGHNETVAVYFQTLHLRYPGLRLVLSSYASCFADKMNAQYFSADDFCAHTLGPLTLADTEKLVCRNEGAAPLFGPLLQQVYGCSGGRPLLIQILMADVVEVIKCFTAEEAVEQLSSVLLSPHNFFPFRSKLSNVVLYDPNNESRNVGPISDMLCISPEEKDLFIAWKTESSGYFQCRAEEVARLIRVGLVMHDGTGYKPNGLWFQGWLRDLWQPFV